MICVEQYLPISPIAAFLRTVSIFPGEFNPQVKSGSSYSIRLWSSEIGKGEIGKGEAFGQNLCHYSFGQEA